VVIVLDECGKYLGFVGAGPPGGHNLGPTGVHNLNLRP
jgi:hypothetical protein